MLSHAMFSTLFTVAVVLTSPEAPPTSEPLRRASSARIVADLSNDLILDRLHSASLRAASLASHRVMLREPGMLTVLLDGTGDLVLRIRDAAGDVISESDQDIDDRLGREGVAIRIALAGEYTIEIEEIAGEQSQFTLMASLTPFAPFRQDAMPTPRRLAIDTLSGSGAVSRTLTEVGSNDAEYFVFVPTRTGLLTIMTSAGVASDLDLMIEQFDTAEFGDEALRSADHDLGGDLAQEAMTIAVRAGEPIFLRIAVLEGTPGAEYRLTTELR